MKAFWLKSSLVTALLILIAAVGVLPIYSDSRQTLKTFNEPPTQKRRARATEPLTYRSPGARHKLVIRDDDLELQQQLQAARVIHKARRFNDYSLVEISSETLDQLAPQALERAQLRDDLNIVRLRRGQIDTTGPEPVVAEDLRQTAGAARALHLVQLFGPPTPDTLAAVKATGARIVAYVPNNTYLVWGSPSQMGRIAAMRQRGDIVQWDGPYHPAYKIDPQIQLDSVAQNGTSITVLDTPEAVATLARIKAVARKVLMPEYTANGEVHIKVLTESLNLKQLSQLPSVIGIEPWSAPRLMDERANQIVANQLTNEMVNNIQVSRPTAPGYLAYLNSLGFTSDFDFAIDIADTGFDAGSDDPAHMHADFTNAAGQSRMAYVLDYMQDSSPFPAHDGLGHGTLNASIAAGFNNKTGSAFQDASGYSYGLGVAPYARIGISKIFNDTGDGFTQTSYGDLIANAYRHGARISNNSWGGRCTSNLDCNIYRTDCQIYDGLVRDADPLQAGNQGMVILFSSGNEGEAGDPSVSVPSTAKNVISVGASENYRPTDADGRPSTDVCGTRATDGDNSLDMEAFSGFGPVQDGRAKPDIVAPGTFVVGAASQYAAFSGGGVCNIPGSLYYPAGGQHLYTISTGTSHSAPIVAGAAALAFKWLRGPLSHDPSPALVKALMLNSTSYLTGRFSNDDLPGAHQGWGLLNIGRMFEPTDRILYDQSPDRTFTESGGQPFEISGVISDPTKEFRVMLAYSDAPGADLSSAPYVNQLNLEVVIGGSVVYQANNFAGPYSQLDGQPDFRNNTQGVRLPAGTTGPFVIRVKPAVIAGDGVPGFGGTLDQDFALVVSNGIETALPVLTIDNSGDVSAGVTVRHANDVVDSSVIPGEQAVININVTNKSATAAANFANATLSLTVGNQTVSGGFAGGPPATLPPGESASLPFTLQIPANLGCGAVAKLQLSIETDISTFKLPVRVQTGRPSGATILFIDDDVDNARVKWKMKKGFEVVNNSAQSGTMAYHVQDPGKESGDTRLAFMFTKKLINIPANSGGVRLSFYHIFNFEPGYDGGVVEISTDEGATWEDLGSHILVGGYDGKVTAASNNPLGSRAAWTLRGVPGVYSQVIVNLDDFAGKRIKIRFQAGFDEATGILDGFKGWFIDDIRISATPFACGAASSAEEPASESDRQIWLRQRATRPTGAHIE